MDPAPIALFAFNRPDHLSRVLEALAANRLADRSSLTLFCDGPRNDAEKIQTDATRGVARAATGFANVRVVEREQNLGCARSFIQGLEEMFAAHERLVVMEDDILCSPHTLEFLNTGLERYADEPAVFNIAAWSPPPRIFPIPDDYPYDTYAIPRFNCWGWASWRDRFTSVDWDVTDYDRFIRTPVLQRAYDRGGADMTTMLRMQMEGRLNTWDVRVDYARFRHGRVGINPVRAYTTNIGFGGGTHCTVASTRFDNDPGLARPVDESFRWMDSIFVDASLRRRYCQAVAPWWKIAGKTILSTLGLEKIVRRMLSR